MAGDMTIERAVAVRMANQGLATRPAVDPRGAARVSAGIQAQDLWASRLAVRARSTDAVVDDVITAAAAPTVVRTWLMRGTLHMVAADDLRWLVDLVGPAVLKMAGPRFDALGLTEAIRERARTVLPAVLAGRALTRAELVAELSRSAPGLPVEGQGPAHLTVWASAGGLICRAGEQGAEPTYALIEEWVPARSARRSTADDLAELVRRYVRAFGPATVEDFAAWSRLLVSAARRTFAELGDEFETVHIDGRTHYLYAGFEPARRCLRLLPAFDSYLMGYRRRDGFLDPARRTEVALGGMIYPSIVADGVIIGTWRLDRSRDPVRVRAEFFVEPTGWQRAQLAQEADDVGRFLGRSATLSVVDSLAR